jgi:hypothetical protein
LAITWNAGGALRGSVDGSGGPEVDGAGMVVASYGRLPAAKAPEQRGCAAPAPEESLSAMGGVIGS